MYFSESTFDSLQLDYVRTAELRNDIKFGSILLPQSPTMISVEHPDKVRPWNVLVETIEGDQAAYKRELDALFSEVVEGIPFESKWYADEMTEVYKDLLHMRTTIVAFTCAAGKFLVPVQVWNGHDCFVFPCCLCWQACYWPFLWRGSVYSR